MKFVLSFVIFMGLYGECAACRCLPMTNLEKGCKADFILKTKVIAEPSQSVDFYKIMKPKQTHIYKFNDQAQIPANKIRRLYVDVRRTSCETTLKQGDAFVIAGRIDKKKKRLVLTDLCSAWVEQAPFSKPTEQLLKEFKMGKSRADRGPANSEY